MCRAILAPKNKAVDRINDEILQSLTQKSYICSSVDAILDPEIVNSISEFTRTNETPTNPEYLYIVWSSGCLYCYYGIWTHQIFVMAPNWCLRS